MTDFVKVFIETERGSDRQYKWNPITQELDTHRILPITYRFPYAFGHVPNTMTEMGKTLPALYVSDRKYKSGTYYFGYIIGVLSVKCCMESTIETEKEDKTPPHQILIVYPIDDLVDHNLNEVYDLDSTILQQIQWFFTNHWEVKSEKGKSFVLGEFSHRQQAVLVYQDTIARWKQSTSIAHSF
jgi:inorganic pyrophosphatase